MTDLFQRVPEGFIGHSGGRMYWKVEYDAVSPVSWDGLAWMVRERLYSGPQEFHGFRCAVGIPRGGVPFADALNKYANPRASLVLLVDDVWTTGGSMRLWRDTIEGNTEEPDPAALAVRREIHWDALTSQLLGVVAFARGRVDPWVMAAWVTGDQRVG